MKAQITLQLPEALNRAVDSHERFNAAQRHYVSPVFRELLADVQGQTPYDSIRDAYSIFEGESGQGVEFGLRNSNPIWLYREVDTAPHWAPWGPETSLGQWAEERGIEPFLVARKIAAEGTEGNYIVRDSWKDYEPRIQEASQRAFYAWARAFGDWNGD